jgi:thioredoxin
LSRWVEELDDELLDEWVETEPLLVVDFYADWCGPCKAMSPVVERAAKHFAGRITFGKLNIDGSPERADRYGVKSIPTLIIFKDGKPASRTQGYISDARLQDHLNTFAPPVQEPDHATTPSSRGLIGRLFRTR